MKLRYLVLFWMGIGLAFSNPANAQDKWTDQQDAIGQLWSGRSPVGTAHTFPVDQCDNWGTLPQNVKDVSTQTRSGLVVPSVSATRAVVTNGLQQMAQSLHAYNVGTVATGFFYPTDNIDGPLNMNAAFWQDAARSPHGNALNHLPQLNLAGLNNANCPAGMAAMNRANLMNTLDQQPGISNSQRWHCYSERFSVVGGANIPLTGYVEFTQIEIPADNQYAFAAADGRIVYDYVNNLVYFTPAHYRQWKKADFAPDMTGGYGCTPGGTCCDPFFKIVP